MGLKKFFTRAKNAMQADSMSKDELLSLQHDREVKLENVEPNPARGSYLKRVPLLSRLTPLERNKLGALFQEREYQDGVDITTEGEDGEEFYIIKYGKAKVMNQGHTIAQLKEGDYFGEQALLNACRRGATVRAMEFCTCFVLKRHAFDSLFNKKALNVHFGKRNAIRSVAKDGPALSGKTIVGNTKNNVGHLKMSITGNKLFKGITQEKLEGLLDQIYVEDVPKDTKIIKQGERGDKVYIIYSGSFQVTVVDEISEKETFRSEMSVGVFGELALMYNCPRKATVTALEDSVVWVVERYQFRKFVMQMSKEKIREYSKFIEIVPLLSSLLHSEREKLAEAFDEAVFQPRATIMEHGTKGEDFFIVTKGKVSVQIPQDDGSLKEVTTIGRGGFFGERALVKDELRAASVIALEKTKCLTIDRNTFITLLGPLQDAMGGLYDGDSKIDMTAAKVESTSTAVASIGNRTDIKVEDLTVIGNLGIGSYGLVQLVKFEKTNEYFALKKFGKQALVESEDFDQVVNEQELLSQIDHPFIVRLHGKFKDKNHVYLLIDVCLGGDLFGLLKSQISFPEHACRFYAASIVLAFEYLHERDIVHRDLKPENILLDKSGYLRLVDFGLAKTIKHRSFTLCGTPCYLAPEMIKGVGHGKGVDWWTLGVLIYEMMTGYTPFDDNDPMEICQKVLEGELTFPTNFSKLAMDLVKKLLSPKPTKRYGVIKGGVELIKRHKWFAPIDWDKLKERALEAPFLPEIHGDEDMGNFFNEGITDDLKEFTGDEAIFQDF